MIRKVILWIHSWPPDTSGRLRPVFSSSSESQLSGTSVSSKHLWSVLGPSRVCSHRLDLPPVTVTKPLCATGIPGVVDPTGRCSLPPWPVVKPFN